MVSIGTSSCVVSMEGFYSSDFGWYSNRTTLYVVNVRKTEEFVKIFLEPKRRWLDTCKTE